MIDADHIVAECQAAIRESDPRLAVRDLLHRLTRTTSFGDDAPDPGAHVLHQAPDLTVLHVVWPPFIQLQPHNHLMWAAIGIYAGREDNTLYRRDGDAIVVSGGKELHEHDVFLLGADAIHGVTNPARAYTGAIHVYGGDLNGTPRSTWTADALEEQPYDFTATQRAFADAELRFRDSS
jgi:predicted metal-dependent enzyme (double-stranded beta helix superfamily)